LLLDAIAAFELDPHLAAIADAVHARRGLLRTVRAANAISQLCPALGPSGARGTSQAFLLQRAVDSRQPGAVS
jgi:hypothetical protein